SSAGVPLSSPAAAQRCAEGAGLDSGAPAEAQSAMPSIAALTIASTADHLSPTPLPSMAPQLQSRISTSLTDVTAPPGDPRVLDNAPIAMLLAILPANFAAQEHDGRRLSAHWRP